MKWPAERAWEGQTWRRPREQPRVGPRLDSDVFPLSAPGSTRAQWSVVAVVGLLLVLGASCGDAGNVGAPVNDEDAASANPRTVGEDPDYDCPEHGGKCLGPLAAGTYATQVFGPRIVYTVPAGWTNGEDLPGNFLLQREGDDRYLGIYRNVAAPDGCNEWPLRGIGRDVNDLVAWLMGHPGLTTSGPVEVSVGGLDGVQLDLSLAQTWKDTCPYSQGQPVVPFIVGGNPSDLHHVLLPGFEERLYLLDHGGRNVAIEVGAEGQDLDEYLDEILPIIETLEFDG
jgi:hypothetical protein